MTSNDALIAYYRTYAAAFDADVPLYATVCREIGQHRDLVELIAAHEPAAQQPNLLFAAVHDLLLGGLDHPLAQVYASPLPASRNTTALFADLVLQNRALIDELLASRRTQTNEVGRSAFLTLMLQDAQRRAGHENQPNQALAWIDLGASGGLNLNVDRFRIDYHHRGEVVGTGPASTVELACDVRAGKPSFLPDHADIGWRVGVDQAPIDVTDTDQARWLHACLWPTQADRHARLEAAVQIARQHPPRVIAADAAEGVALAVEQAPADLALVMTTTWVWYYLPAETQHGVLEVLRGCGRPVRWYSLEGEGVVHGVGAPSAVTVERSQLGVVEISGAAPARAELLGAGHPHGAWLDWNEAGTPTKQ